MGQGGEGGKSFIKIRCRDREGETIEHRGRINHEIWHP